MVLRGGDNCYSCRLASCVYYSYCIVSCAFIHRVHVMSLSCDCCFKCTPNIAGQVYDVIVEVYGFPGSMIDVC